MIDKLVTMLEAAELAFEKVAENELASGFTIQMPDGQELSFPLAIQAISDTYNDEYLRLTIVPFLAQPPGGFQKNVADILIQINHDLPLAKFAYDADGDIEMILDLPLSMVTEASFSKALQTLADYAAEYFDEVSGVI